MSKKQKQTKIDTPRDCKHIEISSNENSGKVFSIIDSEHKIAVQYCQIIAVVFTVLNTLLIAHLNNVKNDFSDLYKYSSITSLFLVFLTLIISYSRSLHVIKMLSTHLNGNAIGHKNVKPEYANHIILTLKINFWILSVSFILFMNTTSLVFLERNLLSTLLDSAIYAINNLHLYVISNLKLNFYDFYI